MAAALALPPQLDSGLGAGAVDKGKMAAEQLPPPQVHTPPTTDEGSHKDDDAASSSSLSDLGDDIEDEENRMRFEEAARAGAEAEQHTEIKPDRYENGVPIFTPVCTSRSQPSDLASCISVRTNSSRLWTSSESLINMSRPLIHTACSRALFLSILLRNGMYIRML